MITLSDLQTYDAAGDWTSGKVAALSQFGKYRYKVLLKQYAPEWATRAQASISIVFSGTRSDAQVFNGNLVCIVAETGNSITQYTLPNEDEANQDWTSVSHAIASPVTIVSLGKPSDTEEEDARAWYYLSDTVYAKNLQTGNTDSWYLGHSVSRLAATAGDSCHFVYKTSKNNWRLGYLYGSGSVVESDIYWPFKVNGFAACQYGNEDVILMSTELPPVADFTINENKLTPVYSPIEGIVAFRFNRTSRKWSDYNIVWKHERDDHAMPGPITVSAYPNADGQNELFAVAPIDVGYADNPADRYVMGFFKSRDGESWEAPVYYNSWPWPVDDGYLDYNWAKLLRNGKYMYMAHPNFIKRSVATCYMGDADPALTEDLTHYATTVTVEASKERHATIELTNPDGVLTDTGRLLSKEVSIMTSVWMGYRATVGAAEAELVCPAFRGFVGQVDETTALPERSLLLHISDPLELINSSGSSDAIELDSFAAGGDNFAGTDIGINSTGLGHVAPMTGIWKNGITDALPAGGLLLQCEGEEGIAANTTLGRSWNGLISSEMKIFPTTGTPPDLDGETWQGLFCKAGDKNNLVYVKWTGGNPSTYQLVRRYIGSYGDPVQNGRFDASDNWTPGTGWTIFGGKAIHAAGSASSITQDLTDRAAIGARYKVRFLISGWSAGAVHAVLGTTVCPNRSEMIEVKEDYDASGNPLVMVGTAAISIVASADFDGTIDNVSIEPVPMDYELPNSGTNVGLYSVANATPYESGRVALRWKYNYVEVYLDWKRILHYELVGCGTSGSWTKVTVENGLVGYPLFTGQAGYIGATLWDSENLVSSDNPGVESPLVLVGANDLASGWSVQGATATRVDTQHHRGDYSLRVVPSVDVNGLTGVRFAKYFGNEFHVMGDSYMCRARIKVPFTNTSEHNDVGAIIEAQYEGAIGRRGDYSSNSNMTTIAPTTENGGWVLFEDTIAPDPSKRVAKIILEIVHGYDPGATIEFFVDDVQISSDLSRSDPLNRQYLSWSDAHCINANSANSLQDVVQRLIAYAGVAIDPAYADSDSINGYVYSDASQFTLTGGMSYLGGSLSSDSGVATAASPDTFAPSFVVDFDKNCDQGQVNLCGTAYGVAWRAYTRGEDSGHELAIFAGETERVFPVALPTICHLRIATWVRADNSKTDRLNIVDWLTIVVYADDAYVASASFPVTSMAALTGMFGFGSCNSAAFEVSNVTVPNLYRVIPYASIDPGEKVSDSMSRAVQNFRVLVHSRFNGRVIIKKIPVVYDSVWSGLSTSLAEGSSRNRILCPPNAWRIVGAWKETDWIKHDAIQAAWRRIFERVDNPNLITPAELQLEVQYLTQDFAGQLSKPGVQMPYYPLLEVGDTIMWNSSKMCIDGLRIAMGMSDKEYIANNEVSGREVE